MTLNTQRELLAYGQTKSNIVLPPMPVPDRLLDAVLSAAALDDAGDRLGVAERDDRWDGPQ